MLGLKKNKFNIFCAWTLLICFVAGQYMVYVHQHNIVQKSVSIYNVAKNQSKPAAIIQEKCYMCDAMHNNAMTISHFVCFDPIVVTAHIFKVGDYDFVSIALILSAGRAPPSATYSC